LQVGIFRHRKGARSTRSIAKIDPFEQDELDEGPERSLLEIESDPEMIVAQAEVDAQPLTPRSPAADPDPYAAW
jgi:hypothetical protein